MREEDNVLEIKDFFYKRKQRSDLISDIDFLINDEFKVLEFKEIKLRLQIKKIAREYYEGRYDIDDEG